jgi:hypothetical protein
MTPSGMALPRRLQTFVLALVVTLSAALSLGAIAAYATQPGEIAITDEGASRLDLWTLGPNAEIYQRTWQGSSISPWISQGAPTGGAGSAPEAVHFPNGHYMLLVRGQDDGLWEKDYWPAGVAGHTTAGWTSWTDLGGHYATGVTASMSDNGNSLDVVGRDTNGNLDWSVWTPSGGWIGYTRTSYPIASRPAAVDWTEPGHAPQTDVFTTIGGTGMQMTTIQNGQFYGWLNLAGDTSADIDGDFGDGHTTIVARGLNNSTVYYNTASGHGWAGWTALGGTISTGASVHYWPTADGRPRWIVIGRDQGDPSQNRPPQIVRDEWDPNSSGGGAWGGWAGFSTTPDADFWGNSVRFGGDDGKITTPEEIAAVVKEYRATDPAGQATIMAGINPAERPAVQAALDAADQQATVAMTHDGSDRLDLWTVGPTEAVYQRTWTSGNGWGDWGSLQGPPGGAASAPSVARAQDGKYFVFATDHQGSVWWKRFTPSGGWGGWENLPGNVYAGGVSAYLSHGDGWLDLVGHDKDGQLLWSVWTPGGGWGLSKNTAGSMTGTPAAVNWEGTASYAGLRVYSTDQNNQVRTTLNQSVNWSAWSDLGFQALPLLSADLAGDRLLLAGLSTSGHTAVARSYYATSGWDTSWSDFGGNLSSAPTVHSWPTADGTARWEFAARDIGNSLTGRPAMLVRDEFIGSNPVTGWTMLSSPPASNYYWASVTLDTGNNGAVDTQSEINTGVTALRGADAMSQDSILAGITPGTQRDSVWQAAFQASWECGGTDRRVNAAVDVTCVISGLDGASTDVAAKSYVDSLLKDDAPRVDSALRARVNDGDYVRRTSDAAVFYYANGVYNWIPSTDFASAAGIDLNSAERITNSAMSGWTRGADATYPTSWRYGGVDHVVNADAEAQAMVGAYQGAGTDSSANSIYAGLAPGDNAIIDAKLRSTIGDRQLARVATTGFYYYVEDGVASQFTSTGLVADAGLDTATAKRISAGAESGYQQGPAITSSSFDAGDGAFSEDLGEATAASASWHFKGIGAFDFFTSDGIAVAAGAVKWWNGNSLWTSQTRRGETTYGSALSATSSVGCIWVKATYTAPRYTFSIPGPGASMANESQSNGYIYHCRSSSQTRPVPISLAGFGTAKFWLGSVTLTICTSATVSAGPRYCANHKNSYPGD